MGHKSIKRRLFPDSYPYDRNILSRIKLSPNNVDCIVFWTKNPIPMLDKFEWLDEMGYSYYTQFTLTPYDKTLESNLPPKAELIQAIIKMSKSTSAEQAIWRYDPVIADEKHSVEWHIEQFSKMCRELSTYTKRCIFSFVNPYKKISSKFSTVTVGEMNMIAAGFAEIAKQYGITLYTCAEEIDLTRYNINHGACIDKDLIEQITGSSVKAKNDPNQRSVCCCIESIDLGV